MDDNAINVIHQAERIVYAASWHAQEEAALQRLAGTHGLARARLEPRSDVIQLVTYDGEHVGHIRRETNACPGERWVAVLKDGARQIGTYRAAHSAANALVHASGKRMREQPGT